MDSIYQFYEGLPRQGPGSKAFTERAYTSMRNVPPAPLILDIGSGSGGHTLTLASLSEGRIIALDIHQPYLNELKHRAQEAGLTQRVSTVQGSFFELNFDRETFDIIWSEGAVYIIGFERGIRYWKEFLKPGGWMAVSELCWFRADPPEELARFWKVGYPEMKSVEETARMASGCGLEVADHFPLDVASWWENYYDPLQDKIRQMDALFHDSKEASLMRESLEEEIRMYRTYPSWYGYEFFILRKPE